MKGEWQKCTVSEGCLVHSLQEVQNENINENLEEWKGFAKSFRRSVLTVRRPRLAVRAESS